MIIKMNLTLQRPCREQRDVETWGELGVEELQELELDSKALVRSGGCEALGRLGLPSRPFEIPL